MCDLICDVISAVFEVPVWAKSWQYFFSKQHDE